MVPSTAPAPGVERGGVWGRAAGLQELAEAWSLAASSACESSAVEPGDGDPDPDQLLAEWRKALLVEDDAWLDLRLEQDGLDREGLRYLLFRAEKAHRENRWPEVRYGDDWPAWIEAFATDVHHHEPLPFHGEDREKARKAAEESPFSGILLPILRVAVARLRERFGELERGSRGELPLTEKALARMVDALGQRVFAVLSPTLVLELNVARLDGRLEGDDGPSRLRFYSTMLLAEEESRRAIYEEYTVLARLLVSAVRFWIDAVVELVRRYRDDRRQIADTLFGGEDPGAIADVGLSLSDPHRGGRTVVVLELGSGHRLVYKPKSLHIDLRFQELLCWLGEIGLEHPHRLLKVLPRDDYGWCEHIEAEPCDDLGGVERFYWRQGSFLALLYVLYGCDFHYENLIAAGETPVLVDLESLFHNQGPQVGEGAPERASRRLLESVYGIGLLPLVTRDGKDAPSVDLGGMSGRGGIRGFEAPVLVDRQLDTMRFEKQRVAVPEKQNRPTLRGEEVFPLDHLAVFLRGFRDTYDLMATHALLLEERLRSFADLPIRYIPRPTVRYMRFLQQTRHPDYLRRGIDQDRLLEHLWAEVGVREGLAPLVPSERRDLRQGDVPFFTTTPTSRHLWNSRRERLDRYFAASSLERVIARVRGLGTADREAQETLIGQALLPLDHKGPTIARPVRVRLPAEIDPPGSESYLQAARRIGERLAEQAVLGDDDVTWIGATTTGGDHWQWALTALGPPLYDGVAGVGLFLAYLGELTGDARYQDLARRSARALRDHLEPAEGEHSRLPDVGAFSGASGVLYASSHLASLWREPALLDEALDACLPALIEAVPEETGLDLMIGSAGCAVIALDLHGHTGDGRLLELARACGDRLIATAEPQATGVGWVSGAASRALAGFSHGCAGIAWSLRRLAARFDDPRLVDLAEQGLIYERSLYDPDSRNWRDVRDLEGRDGEEPHPLAWCHGGPGVALGRTLTRPFLGAAESEPAAAEIRAAAEETLLHGFGGNHSLCHGDLGNAEILLRLAEDLGEASWRQEALRHTTRVAAEVAAGAWKCGLPRHAETPGLMLGLAGIGLGLLRLAAPDRVPSVLDLSPPARRSRAARGP
ncbi:MAG: type 2 lantipeptide synthetase LanM family protein [Holophagales bacterium]|nr:type 2 lantipeptide synthetase LanM family protein [Holophagales bacterium]